MSKNVVYYPYIKVPESAWFSRILLYWDSVASIVPTEYLEHPERLGTYTQSLVREGLVTQLVPAYHLSHAPNFSKPFIEYLEAKAKLSKKSSRKKSLSKTSRPIVWEAVHMEKLYNLSEYLVDKGLAHREKDDPYSPWFMVEPEVAKDFMSYLAIVLGQADKENRFDPITDDLQHLNPFLDNSSDENIRYSILEGVLPVPTRKLTAAQILEFKSKHYGELVRFRNLIEEEISQLSVIPTGASRDKRKVDVIKRLQGERQELAQRMKEEKGWRGVGLANICAIAGSSIGFAQAMALPDWRWGAGGAALSFVPILKDVFNGRDLLDKPLAYACLAPAFSQSLEL